MRILNHINFIIATLLFAIFLPLMLDTAFSKDKNSVKIYYSEVLDRFLTQEFNKDKKVSSYKIELDEEISLDEFMQNLPFKFYSYLIQKDLFPSEFSEFADIQKIKQNSQALTLKPEMLNQKQPAIFTILESNPKYLKFRFNEFGIRNSKNGLEFISFETLKVDKSMSDKFTNALIEAGFKFPFKAAYANPNVKKPFDEGAFIIDSNDKIYHLKMVDFSAKVVDTGIKNSSVLYILVNENPRKEFYGAIVDKDGVSLISYDNYRLINLISSGYNPKNSKFWLSITPLSRVVTIQNDSEIRVLNLDANHNIKSEFAYLYDDSGAYKSISEFIFTFKIKKDDGYAYKLGFFDFSFKAFFINFLLCLVFFVINFRKDRSVFKLLVILFTGIYGFLASLLI